MDRLAPVPTRTEFLHIPPWQQALFYALMGLSLLVMGWQVMSRVRLWMAGKPIWWRPNVLANIAKFVAGQKKVQTSRPKSGAPMHLLIFYGFLALFVATLLLAVNTYSPVKFHKGLYYLIYEATFDALGLLFVVGVAWALGRRWLARPVSVSNAPADTYTLLLLLALGLTGYLLEAARISNSPQVFDRYSAVGLGLSTLLPRVSDGAYVGIWWFHVALVVAFFVTLPRMRIRHVLMAILSAGGKSEAPMGRLEPIRMEEVEKTGQIGVSTPADYSRWHLMSLDACMECGRCTEVCPAWKVGKVLNPKQVVQDIRLAEVNQCSVAEAVSEEALWACTTCNACVEACPVLIRHVDLIVDARRNLVAEGRFAGSGALMLRQIASTANAWGAPRTSREDWMKGLDVPLCRDGKPFEYLFWVGCAGATDPGAIRTTRAVAELLAKAGVSFACLGNEEACSGDPARRVGDEFLFQEQATGNAGVFEKYGVKKVLTACPHCFNTLKNEYGDFGQNIQVFHHSQVLAQLVADERLRAPGASPGGTVFHDPCYLARVNNESDAPRQALGQASNLNDDRAPLTKWVEGEPTVSEGPLIEPEHYGRKTLCCGAGGGRLWMEEPVDQRPSDNRARELLATGAKTVAVGCPYCRIMLDAGLKQVATEEIRLVDLAEMLQEANA